MHPFALERERLLANIVAAVKDDPRFVAGWLSGSYGRFQQDPFSDLDITLVVTDEAAPALCARSGMVSETVAAARLALFAQFGQVAIAHENHNNAPDGGTFTFTAYAETGQTIDWVLVPLAQAKRPFASHPLFAKIDIPTVPPPAAPTLAERQQQIAEPIAFFWLMAASAVKLIARGDGYETNWMLASLTDLVAHVTRLVKGEPFVYRSRPVREMLVETAVQANALRSLCKQMLTQMNHIRDWPVTLPADPMPVIETRLRAFLADG
jgi:hypothetical protein